MFLKEAEAEATPGNLFEVQVLCRYSRLTGSGTQQSCLLTSPPSDSDALFLDYNISG